MEQCSSVGLDCVWHLECHKFAMRALQGFLKGWLMGPGLWTLLLSLRICVTVSPPTQLLSL